MIDIFLSEDVHALMKDKYVVFMGDSNIRALYKDFLCLLTENQLIPNAILKRKMEPGVFGDKLTFHREKRNYRDYREERQSTIGKTHVAFYFLTQVYNNYVKALLRMIKNKKEPDVIVLNSLLWDITRWGVTGVDDYKKNLRTLMKHLNELFPDCLVIWITVPPISKKIKGGFLVKGLEFLQHALRFHVMEANYFARKVVVENGFDVLDCHYHLKMQIHRRAGDGIHWMPTAIRYVTNLLLTHISLSWNVQLPHRYESSVGEMDLGFSEDEERTMVPEEKRIHKEAKRRLSPKRTIKKITWP